MLINRQEISGPGGAPVQVDHVDHVQRITSRLDAIAERMRTQGELPALPAPSDTPMLLDLTANKEPIAATTPEQTPAQVPATLPEPEISAAQIMARMSKLKL
jgi:hypothetical protein